MDICFVFESWLLSKILFSTFVLKFCVDLFSFLLGIFLGVELLSHMITPYVTI